MASKIEALLPQVDSLLPGEKAALIKRLLGSQNVHVHLISSASISSRSTINQQVKSLMVEIANYIGET